MMPKFKPLGNFVDHFRRRNWWRTNLRPAESDIEAAEREGASCAEAKTAYVRDGVLQGPGVDEYTYRLEINIERTMADIEEDCAPIIQVLSPIYAVYQGGVERLGVVAKRLDDVEARLSEEEDTRAKNQARLELEDVKAEYDSLFNNLEQLHLKAEESGLPDLRAIQASRLADATRRRAYQDCLRTAFTKGACSVLGVECESTRINLDSTIGVIDTYIKQLEGQSGDGRWTMDFTAHLRHRKGNSGTQVILSEKLQ